MCVCVCVCLFLLTTERNMKIIKIITIIITQELSLSLSPGAREGGTEACGGGTERDGRLGTGQSGGERNPHLQLTPFFHGLLCGYQGVCVCVCVCVCVLRSLLLYYPISISPNSLVRPYSLVSLCYVWYVCMYYYEYTK